VEFIERLQVADNMRAFSEDRTGERIKAVVERARTQVSVGLTEGDAKRVLHQQKRKKSCGES